MDVAPKIVVIAEDEVLVRMLAADVFTEAGYQVIEAQHGAEALDALYGGNVHLLFTDIHMPGEINGLHLARLARQHCPRTHIIITSGEYPCEPHEMPEGGMFFRKPYQIDHVVSHAKALTAA